MSKILLNDHSGRLDIFRIKAYFDLRFRIRQFQFNPGYLSSFSAPKSRYLKIFPFKTNFHLIKGPFKAGFTVFSPIDAHERSRQQFPHP
jgi:hypothetical protein